MAECCQNAAGILTYFKGSVLMCGKEFLEVPYNNFGQPDFGLPVFFIP